MKDGSQRALTPTLRFPEFRDGRGWGEEPLSSAVRLVSGFHLSPDQYGRDGTHPYFTGPSDFTNDTCSLTKWTSQSTAIANQDDTLITVKGSGVGEIWYLTLPSVAMGRQLMAVRTTKGSSRFVHQLLLTKRTRFEDLASGNLIPGLSRGDILDLLVAFPPTVSEQQKIADCLTSLDTLIFAHDRKLEALCAHQKGLIQELFPREGQPIPRLRFPEFRDAPEWQEMRLGNVAPLQRGFDLPSDQLRPGAVPVVYSNGVRALHEAGMAKGPGIVTGRSGTIGNLHFIESGDYWPHNTTLWVTNFKGNDPRFIFYLLAWIGLDRFASGSGVPTLNRNDVHAHLVRLPTRPAEQRAIARCLDAIAMSISAQERNLHALKAHKKGLMQQLFPSAERGL